MEQVFSTCKRQRAKNCALDTEERNRVSARFARGLGDHQPAKADASFAAWLSNGNHQSTIDHPRGTDLEQAMIHRPDPEADRLLHTWADWARRPSAPPHGYPTRSTGFLTGGASSVDAFDDLCAAADKQVARAIDAVIDSLPSYAKVAIYEAYLHGREAADVNLDDVLGAFLNAARTRGVLG